MKISKKLSMVKVRDLSEGERVAINICVLLSVPMLNLESKLHATSLRYLKSSKTFELTGSVKNTDVAIQKNF